MAEIAITCRAGKTTIEAERLGPFAVHLSVGVKLVDGTNAFTVTHIASGRKATPFHFGTHDDAAACARALTALPVDWSAEIFPQYDGRLRAAVFAVSDLCGGFLVSTPIDAAAAGSA